MVMKKVLLFTATALVLVATSFEAMAQSVIYRCGNEYLNDAALAIARGCQVVEGGNVTVVPGTRVNRGRRSTAVNAMPNTDAAVQRARDGDARSILLAELKIAEARLADQQREYNNGAPEKLDAEMSNPQRYLDRVNELKEGVNRYTGDIAGLKREIARLPAVVSIPGQ
jgi:hypothetical protein